MNKHYECICLFAASIFTVMPMPGHAASGTVDIIVSASSSMHAVEMGETTVTSMAGNGTVTFAHSSGRPFVDGASATVRYAGFSKKTPSGLELEADALATFSPDDTLQLLFQRRTGDAGPLEEGTLQLIGGSGKFAGVSGECRYRMEDVPAHWNVTARCEWLYSFPYR